MAGSFTPKQEGMPMEVYQQTIEQSDEPFLRDVGVSKQTFQFLLEKITAYLAEKR